MMISRELPPCRLRVCRDFIPPAFLDHDLTVRLWVLCPCAQFRERHHFGWADGSSAIHLLQCIALAVSTRPIQWRAELGKVRGTEGGCSFLGRRPDWAGIRDICWRVHDLESILHARTGKIVLQHNP